MARWIKQIKRLWGKCETRGYNPTAYITEGVVRVRGRIPGQAHHVG